jgi:(2Fe-2S) ferredoxin
MAIAKRKGRRPSAESDGDRIRARLKIWRDEAPEPRPSLRQLAKELGTSHQLLCFYLRGLDEWQFQVHQQANEAIFARARGENRGITPSEESQVIANARAMVRCMIDPVLGVILEGVKKRRRISKDFRKIIEAHARRGSPVVRKILKTYQNNLPLASACSRKPFKSVSPEAGNSSKVGASCRPPRHHA